VRRPRRGPAGQSVRATDDRIQQHSALDSVGAGNGYSLRWNLQKLIGEYARRNGHAESAQCRMRTTAARGKAIGQGLECVTAQMS